MFWTGQPNEVEEPTVMEILEDREGHVAGQRSHLVAPEPIDPSPRRRKLNWKRVVVAALVAFGIAAVSLTVFELATGQRPFRGRGHHDSAGSRGQRRQESDTKKEEPSKKPTEEPTAAASEAPYHRAERSSHVRAHRNDDRTDTRGPSHHDGTGNDSQQQSLGAAEERRLTSGDAASSPVPVREPVH